MVNLAQTLQPITGEIPTPRTANDRKTVVQTHVQFVFTILVPAKSMTQARILPIDVPGIDVLMY